jgi:hypothetical protein
MNLDERTPIYCKCGYKGTMADIEWDWKKKDMSDIVGYCPSCKQPYEPEDALNGHRGTT